ncbi:thioesterase family protein [Phyllobacterium sp. UNC302MFCol5.2]|uniref:acyl-CoA thioesterase n=1 Tax=Phyllobacterium sp. UNC302MFCol5.2 TaxID=1449065 RepID=UPI000480C68A|nr:thioesterase family protein [Phyllobacterium sp. UNC302MFCol5.2]
MGWVSWSGVVDQSWIDELDHVNFLEYQRVADHASLAVWKQLKGTLDSKLEFVMLETYVRYRQELRLGMAVDVETQLVAYDDKRFQLLHDIKCDDDTVCTVETLNLCFDPISRRAAKFAPEMIQALGSIPPPAFAPETKLTIARKQR